MPLDTDKPEKTGGRIFSPRLRTPQNIPRALEKTPDRPSDNLIRLNRYCAQCGLGSRRYCDSLIESGKISVNGAKIDQLGVKIDPIRDKVEYRGATVQPASLAIHLAYHKPRGIIVTKSDPQGRETVFDALAKQGYNTTTLRYIGRLDFNSEGLLLMTSDGSLVHALTHPRYHIKKVYEVCVDKKVLVADGRKMVEEGVVSEGEVLRAGKVSAMNLKTEDGHWYGVDLYEGKKRQIRRIFEGLGYIVMRLKRVQFAAIKIGDLLPGKVRNLTDREVAALMAAGYQPTKR
jgi:23S rRNA pseudouridine2605 synthase